MGCGRPTYDAVHRYWSTSLPRMSPHDELVKSTAGAWTIWTTGAGEWTGRWSSDVGAGNRNSRIFFPGNAQSPIAAARSGEALPTAADDLSVLESAVFVVGRVPPGSAVGGFR